VASLPKPPEQRRRRSSSQASWRRLPPAGEFDRPPKLPVRKPAWLKSTREWWAVLWASPMATVYVEADVQALVRLAEMVEERGRGTLSKTEVIAMQQLEDRFGLNPKSRRALQWEITQAGSEKPEEAGDVPTLRAVPDA